jgi:hypothetical protein
MRPPTSPNASAWPTPQKKAQLDRAKRIAEDPERAERLKAREQAIADGNRRIIEREAQSIAHILDSKAGYSGAIGATCYGSSDSPPAARCRTQGKCREKEPLPRGERL